MKIPKPVKPFYGTTTRGSGLNRLIKEKKSINLVKPSELPVFPSPKEKWSTFTMLKGYGGGGIYRDRHLETCELNVKVYYRSK